eukprot:8171696-Ditylum_brightwellii.AAC.1
MDDEKGLMLMDAMCNLNLNDKNIHDDDRVPSDGNNADKEMDLDKNFLVSEGDDTALGITDNTKSEHPTLLGITNDTKYEHPSPKKH